MLLLELYTEIKELLRIKATEAEFNIFGLKFTLLKKALISSCEND